MYIQSLRMQYNFYWVIIFLYIAKNIFEFIFHIWCKQSARLPRTHSPLWMRKLCRIRIQINIFYIPRSLHSWETANCPNDRVRCNIGYHSIRAKYYRMNIRDISIANSTVTCDPIYFVYFEMESIKLPRIFSNRYFSSKYNFSDHLSSFLFWSP